MIRRKSSALILVILVIAGVITAAFGAQRLVLVQLSQTSSDEDNLSAYYAAKSGIEDGLIRFRHNRDADTGVDDVNNKALVQRVNLSTGNSARYPNAAATQGYVEIHQDTPITTTSGTTSYYDLNNTRKDVDWKMDPYRPTNQYYDLKIQYKTGRIGDFTTFGDILAKDDYLELTGFTPWRQDYFLRYAFRFDSACADKGKAFVQIQKIDSSGGLTQVQASYLNVNPANGAYYSNEFANLTVNSASGPASLVRVRPYHCKVEYAFATSDSVSGLGEEANVPKFDSLKTILTATGYFGRAKRTLIGEIDRKSGTLLGIYDFNLYAGGDVKP